MKFITNKCKSVERKNKKQKNKTKQKKHLSTNKINKAVLKYIDSLS